MRAGHRRWCRRGLRSGSACSHHRGRQAARWRRVLAIDGSSAQCTGKVTIVLQFAGRGLLLRSKTWYGNMPDPCRSVVSSCFAGSSTGVGKYLKRCPFPLLRTSHLTGYARRNDPVHPGRALRVFRSVRWCRSDVVKQCLLPMPLLRPCADL